MALAIPNSPTVLSLLPILVTPCMWLASRLASTASDGGATTPRELARSCWQWLESGVQRCRSCTTTVGTRRRYSELEDVKVHTRRDTQQTATVVPRMGRKPSMREVAKAPRNGFKAWRAARKDQAQWQQEFEKFDQVRVIAFIQ